MNLVTPSLAQFDSFNPGISAGSAPGNSNALKIVGIVLVSLATIGMFVVISKSFSEMSKRMLLENQERSKLS